MELEIIEVNAHNLMHILTDPDVYVIRKDYFNKNQARMIRIEDADTKDILSKKNLIVRITMK